jgi:Zn finger protein HypA/HybF involved in hydrogenase expression
MTLCKHLTLFLLPEKKNMLRCRHCHLTIAADELQGGYCPECFETHGRKLYDFDAIEAKDKGKVRYRCEQCGIIIEIE